MFEPDGRNDLQSIGHAIITVFRYIAYVMGTIALAPLFFFMFFLQTARIQRESITTWNTAPINAVRLDFNIPGLTAQNITAFAAFEKLDLGHNQGKANPANYRTFPAGLATLSGEPRDPYYLWREMPVADYADFGDGEGNRWRRFGMWNMGPDKDWDWSDGEMLIRAKATANFRAYVTAVNMVGKIKAYVISRKYGRDITEDLLTEHSYYLNPDHLGLITVVPDTPMATMDLIALRPRFAKLAETYNNLFKGKLPVVVLHLQDLRHETIQDAADQAKAEAPRWATHHWGLKGQAGGRTSIFITGMTLGASYDRDNGRPEWGIGDFLLWSNPSASSGAQTAQGVLMSTLSLSFWRPLLIAEGLGDDASLSY